jgi:hypothetical protein
VFERRQLAPSTLIIMKCRVFDRDVASQCLNGIAWEERLGEGGFTPWDTLERETPPRFHVISGNNQIAVGQYNSVKLCDTVDSCLGSTSAMETHSEEKLQLRSMAIAEI